MLWDARGTKPGLDFRGTDSKTRSSCNRLVLDLGLTHCVHCFQFATLDEVTKGPIVVIQKLPVDLLAGLKSEGVFYGRVVVEE